MASREAIMLAVAVAAIAVAAFFLGRRTAPESEPSARVDTVVVWKVKSEDRPQFEAEKLLEFRSYNITAARPIFLESTDTVEKLIPYVKDSLIYVPITQQYYERNDGHLRLWVSGYNTSLDRWELDEPEMIVTKRKRWGFSVGAGPAVIYTPFYKPHIDAGIGIFAGLTYTF